ncbi:GTP-binding protein Rho1 [Entophlyctis luteolus]|nr:GTP-binding protein Rho1 [Entophlyctis luteolus]KAJ3384623.1 GTP-binding protein Rho1 [Entophlyctis sp. JEL0112]
MSSPPAIVPQASAVTASKVKFVIVGDGFCGKTCLLIVYCRREFPEEYIPTVFENTNVDVEVDGQPVRLSLWDTAGQEDYSRLRPLSYTDSHAILICFSIDSPDSFENVWETWHKEVNNFCKGVPVVLVGCKKDLRTDPESIATLARNGLSPIRSHQGEAMARKIKAKRYFECSARTGEGVDALFNFAARVALQYSNKLISPVVDHDKPRGKAKICRPL